jgi:hypothetical protein
MASGKFKKIIIEPLAFILKPLGFKPKGDISGGATPGLVDHQSSAKPASKEFKKIIIDQLALILKPLGFKRNGNIFSKATPDLTYYIGLQSSQSSKSSVLKITLNIEIFSAKIHELDDRGIPAEHTKHYHNRIGWFTDQNHDKWWMIDSERNAVLASEEINDLVTNRVIPEFEKLRSADDLHQMLKDGKSMGLTQGQINYYLEKLKE